MTYDHDRFMSYFLPVDSDQPVPAVAPEDLDDFESNVEQLGMDAVYKFRTSAQLAIKGLVKVMEAHPYYPRPGDLAGPYIDSSVIPPIQVPGVRIYRPSYPLQSGDQ